MVYCVCVCLKKSLNLACVQMFITHFVFQTQYDDSIAQVYMFIPVSTDWTFFKGHMACRRENFCTFFLAEVSTDLYISYNIYKVYCVPFKIKRDHFIKVISFKNSLH